MSRPFKDTFFVSIQLILFIAYLPDIAALTIVFPNVIHLIGYLLTGSGIAIGITALINLNRNLSPFPSPKPGSELVQAGIYKRIRHPIYSGILIVGLGLALITNSGSRLIVTLLLLVLFYFKSKYEETKLTEKFSEYNDYRKKSGRFLPTIKSTKIG